MRLCWHNWSKWQSFIAKFIIGGNQENPDFYTQRRQLRLCKKCGKEQERTIK